MLLSSVTWLIICRLTTNLIKNKNKKQTKKMHCCINVYINKYKYAHKHFNMCILHIEYSIFQL